MGGRLRHHRAGIAGNILSVWRVPEGDGERVGALFAARPEVTHCYLRDTFPGFPYNLYAMISARTPEQAQAVLLSLSAESGLTDYVALKTGRELKKSTPRYRRPTE
jgi:DNA-binding Lrp family transcriptional regulator